MPKKRDDEPEERIKFTLDMGALICEMVANGLALKEICALDGMPARTTAYKWLAEHEDFANMYARAREERADLIADEIVTIADTEPDANKARVRIDARKWWAAKVNPKKFGEKATVDLNVKKDASQLTDAELEHIAAGGRPRPAEKANGKAKSH